jgi:hypothetical protein
MECNHAYGWRIRYQNKNCWIVTRINMLEATEYAGKARWVNEFSIGDVGLPTGEGTHGTAFVSSENNETVALLFVSRDKVIHPRDTGLAPVARHTIVLLCHASRGVS